MAQNIMFSKKCVDTLINTNATNKKLLSPTSQHQQIHARTHTHTFARTLAQTNIHAIFHARKQARTHTGTLTHAYTHPHARTQLNIYFRRTDKRTITRVGRRIKTLFQKA